MSVCNMLNKSKILPFCLVATVFSLLACSPDGGRVCCGPPNANIEFSIVDAQGAERLDPSHPHALTEQNLALYHFEEGEKKRVSNGITIYEGEDMYVLRLMLSSYIDAGYTTTFIEFTDASTDTLKMKPLGGDGASVEKLWYNGELVFDVEDPGFFEITKAVE